jgi:putative membrane protein
MSPILADVLVAFVALVQGAIALVELLLWNRPAIHRRLAFTADEARKVAPIVANAGLYNGFVAAGLLWGLLAPGDDLAIKLFFLTCVIVAGIFGAMTLRWTTLLLQALPGALAFLAVWMSP